MYLYTHEYKELSFYILCLGLIILDTINWILRNFYSYGSYGNKEDIVWFEISKTAYTKTHTHFFEYFLLKNFLNTL